MGWYDYSTFDINEYDNMHNIFKTDMHWIIPKKLLAFPGPSSTRYSPEGIQTHVPEDYIEIFKKIGIKLVIRLNKKQYARERFTKHGIDHQELFFLDGSCPDDNIINKFLEMCEKEDGQVAVHCKAGLGRTGVLIGC